MRLSNLFMNMRRLRHLKRCNTTPVIMPEDVAQHSYYVTLLAKLWYDEVNNLASKKLNYGLLLEKCLLHDMEEVFVSDIPYNVKHSSHEFHDTLEEVINTGMSKVIDDYPIEHFSFIARRRWEDIRRTCKDGLEGKVVALCDMLELAIYCYEEVKMGNYNCKHMLSNCREYLPALLNEVTMEMLETSYEGYYKDNYSFPQFYELYLMVFDDTFSSDVDCIYDFS